MTYARGYRYEGEWQDGPRHGPANVTYADGSVYPGQSAHSPPPGKGTTELHVGL